MKVTAIHIYPIKSLAGIALQAVNLQEQGLEHDRRWVLVDEQGIFQSQRSFPQMALFNVYLNEDSLQVIAPNSDEIIIPFTSKGEKKSVSIWDDVVEGVEVSTEISAWFSKQLGKKVSLVKMTTDTNRLIDKRYAKNAETVSFADGYPLLLANTASLNNLNDKLMAPIKMTRFRPNIVFDGNMAFEEDDFTKLSIGAAQIEVVKRCARCVVVNINPATASKEIEVLQVLSQYRKTGNKVHFGVNALVNNGGIIKIGDDLKNIG